MDAKDIAQIITAVTSLVAAIGVIVVKLQQNKNSQKIDRTEDSLRHNTMATVQTLHDVQGVKDVTDQTHLLVDGKHATALMGWATVAQRLADITNDPKDRLLAAEVANRRDEHQMMIRKTSGES